LPGLASHQRGYQHGQCHPEKRVTTQHSPISQADQQKAKPDEKE
jgi:hypothetical protein